MSRMRAVIAAGAIAGSMLIGGVAGAALTGLTTISANAATATTAAAATPSASSGTFKPNEDPTHEAGESAAREAQEDAGQVPNVP
jgi:hypothetical protein